jgi:homoserine kinase type II
MDLESLLTAWPLEGSPRIGLPPRGVSRLTRLVDTAMGSYLLCMYQEETPYERVAYEHGLLAALAQARLPFSVPTPLPIRTGETVVREAVSGRLAALFPVIPGAEPDPMDPAHTRAMGEALGHLHRALAGIDLGPAPTRQSTYGAIDRFLAGTLEPLGRVDDTPLSPEDHGRVGAILARLADDAPAACLGSTRQLRHGDYHSGNVLMTGDRVMGVLDFEVAGPGARAMDLAHGWYYLMFLSPEPPWRSIAAFGAGYRTVVQPADAELAAVPTLTRLYFAASVQYIVGLWRRGDISTERVRARAEQLKHLDTVLDAHAGRLVDVLAGVAG